MLTNITEKSTAYCQQLMFQPAKSIAQKSPCAARVAAFFTSAADVILETGKYPVIAIENVAVGVINISGSPFFEVCNTQDARENLLEIKANALQSIAMGVLAPLNFLGRLCVNLPSPENAHSCNKQVEEQADLPMVTYDLQERRALYKAISKGNFSGVRDALTNSALTSFSVNGALLKTIDNPTKDSDSIMKALLSDGRTTPLGIGKALIHENNRPSKILLSNFPELYTPMLEIETLIKGIPDENQESIAQLPDISEIPSQTIVDIKTRINSEIYENLDRAIIEADKQGFYNFAKWLGQTLKEEQKNLA